MRVASEPVTAARASMRAVLGRIDQLQSRYGTVADGAATSARVLGSGQARDAGDALLGGERSSFAATLARVSARGATSSESAAGAAAADGSAVATPTGQDAVEAALRHLGTPYVWGGDSPAAGFDCSGLLQYTYAGLGVDLPRTAAEQATVGTEVASLDEARPGDLIAFGAPVDHIGMYVGGGAMVVAPHTGDVVKVQPITRQPVAIRRVLPATPTTEDSFHTMPIAGVITSSDGDITRWPLSVVDLTSTGDAVTTDGRVGGPSYADLFRSAGARHGLSADLLAAVAQQESSFDPHAISPAGAQGLMQLMPDTARSLGVDPFEPTQAVEGAAQLLSQHLDRFGSVELALAAYNAGAGAVARYGGVPPYRETRDYVSSIMRRIDATATPSSASTVPSTTTARPKLASQSAAFASFVDGPRALRRVVGDISLSTDEQTTVTPIEATPVEARPVATMLRSAITSVADPGALAPAATPASSTTPTTGAGATAAKGTAPAIELPDATAEVTKTTKGAWGPNTQTRVESRGGSNTTSWDALGYLKPAATADVTAVVPKAKGPVAVGVLRVLQNATAAQLASKEFRQTLNDVNRDALGDLGAVDVIDVDPAADPAPVVATPSNPKGAAPAASGSAAAPPASGSGGAQARPAVARILPT